MRRLMKESRKNLFNIVKFLVDDTLVDVLADAALRVEGVARRALAEGGAEQVLAVARSGAIERRRTFVNVLCVRGC